jgi:hypothetical protein
MATESVTARSLLITGTVGVGKTSVLLELGELLTLGEAPFALVDLDWLAWLRLPRGSQTTVPDVLSENLAHVTRTFRRAGVERLVLARAVRRLHEVESIRAALEPCELTVVRLTAAPSVIARRLGERDSGARLAEHLAEAGAFAAEAKNGGTRQVAIPRTHAAARSRSA